MATFIGTVPVNFESSTKESTIMPILVLFFSLFPKFIKHTLPFVSWMALLTAVPLTCFAQVENQNDPTITEGSFRIVENGNEKGELYVSLPDEPYNLHDTRERYFICLLEIIIYRSAPEGPLFHARIEESSTVRGSEFLSPLPSDLEKASWRYRIYELREDIREDESWEETYSEMWETYTTTKYLDDNWQFLLYPYDDEYLPEEDLGDWFSSNEIEFSLIVDCGGNDVVP